MCPLTVTISHLLVNHLLEAGHGWPSVLARLAALLHAAALLLHTVLHLGIHLDLEEEGKGITASQNCPFCSAGTQKR